MWPARRVRHQVGPTHPPALERVIREPAVPNVRGDRAQGESIVRRTEGLATRMSQVTPRNLPANWRPLRIAVTGGRGMPSNYSGVERICEQMFVWFAERGHKVTVYCRPGVLREKTAVYRGVRLVRTAAPGGKKGETLSHGFTSILHAALRGDVHDGGQPFDLLSVHTIAPAR